jgi:hypothetical protein
MRITTPWTFLRLCAFLLWIELTASGKPCFRDQVEGKHVFRGD